MFVMNYCDSVTIREVSANMQPMEYVPESPRCTPLRGNLGPDPLRGNLGPDPHRGNLGPPWEFRVYEGITYKLLIPKQNKLLTNEKNHPITYLNKDNSDNERKNK